MTERTPSNTGDHLWEFFDADQHPEHRWRHYRLNGERTTPNGLEIVSVTTALGALAKPFLVGWAANLDTEGAFTLAQPGTPWRRCKKCSGVTLDSECSRTIKGKKGKKGRKTMPDEPDQPDYPCDGKTGPYRLPRHWRGLVDDLKTAHLWHDTVRDDAAIRGTEIHEIHENYVRHGTVPDASKYPESYRGYVMAMIRYIIWCEKRGEVPESVEQVVGSATHGFAGACDTVAVSTGRDGKRSRRDFKTSKRPYAKSHFRQLGAYDGAAVEMGNAPCDELVVVILDGVAGEFRATYSSEVEWPEGGAYQSFLNVLQVWRDNQPLEAHEDATYRAEKKRVSDAAKAAKQS